MKKLISYLICLSLFCSLGVSSYAEASVNDKQDLSDYYFFSQQITFGMSPEEVHEALGELPVETNDEYDDLTEYYGYDYDRRPLLYDIDGKWRDSCQSSIFSVGYTKHYDELQVSSILFGVSDNSKQEKFLNMIDSYAKEVSKEHGEPAYIERDDSIMYDWFGTSYNETIDIRKNADSTSRHGDGSFVLLVPFPVFAPTNQIRLNHFFSDPACFFLFL